MWVFKKLTRTSLQRRGINMGTPKQRHTKGRRDRARVQYELSSKELVQCSNCGARIQSHVVCSKCGHYKGREVVNTTKKILKASKK